VSVAAVLNVEQGHVRDVRLALGGVAHKPWRAARAEALLRGSPATVDAFIKAASEELSHARPLRDNGFKVALAQRTMVAVLTQLMEDMA